MISLCYQVNPAALSVVPDSVEPTLVPTDPHPQHQLQTPRPLVHASGGRLVVSTAPTPLKKSFVGKQVSLLKKKKNPSSPCPGKKFGKKQARRSSALPGQDTLKQALIDSFVSTSKLLGSDDSADFH